MFRRWLIRGSFIGLLLLLVAGWGVSTGCCVWCSYCHDRNRIVCGVFYGEVSFVWYRGHDSPEEWDASYDGRRFRIVDPNSFWYLASTTTSYSTNRSLCVTRRRFCCIGFDYHQYTMEYRSGSSVEKRGVSIPFWFLIVVTGAGLWYAWKKTGPRRVARGFPVQAVGGLPGASDHRRDACATGRHSDHRRDACATGRHTGRGVLGGAEGDTLCS